MPVTDIRMKRRLNWSGFVIIACAGGLLFVGKAMSGGPATLTRHVTESGGPNGERLQLLIPAHWDIAVGRLRDRSQRVRGMYRLRAPSGWRYAWMPSIRQDWFNNRDGFIDVDFVLHGIDGDRLFETPIKLSRGTMDGIPTWEARYARRVGPQYIELYYARTDKTAFDETYQRIMKSLRILR